MVLISRSSGRLGNQLFQLANTFNVRRPNQLVIFLGFSDAHSLLGYLSPNSIRIPVPNRLYHFAKKLFRKLQSSGWVTTVTRGVQRPSRQDGRVPFLEVLDEQDCHYPSVLTGNDVLQRCLQLTKEISEDDGRKKCFVHIRLGDYSTFLVGGSPVELPIEWYEAQMELLRQSNPGIVFQVFSDEPAKVLERMVLQSDTELVEGDPKMSFARMATCDAGILSASTFSWWAAAVAHSAGKEGPFVAPAGWESWRTGSWSNPQKATPWLKYRDVCA